MKKALSPKAVADLVPDGARVMIGGFMGVGTPDKIIDALVSAGKKDLTLIANDTALPGRGIGKLIAAGAFNPTMAMAADTVVAEPEHIVPVGVIPPGAVRTPASLVDHLIERST